MKQWLLFEMSKNSLEEKPTEAPPKGTRVGASGCQGSPELLKPEPPAASAKLTAALYPLSSPSLLACSLRVWKL